MAESDSANYRAHQSQRQGCAQVCNFFSIRTPPVHTQTRTHKHGTLLKVMPQIIARSNLSVKAVRRYVSLLSLWCLWHTRTPAATHARVKFIAGCKNNTKRQVLLLQYFSNNISVHFFSYIFLINNFFFPTPVPLPTFCMIWARSIRRHLCLRSLWPVRAQASLERPLPQISLSACSSIRIGSFKRRWLCHRYVCMFVRRRVCVFCALNHVLNR